MILTHFIRDALLERSLPADAPAPSAALHQRLYRAAITLVPPSSTYVRGPEERKGLSDEALLAAYLQGEAGAFKDLMERHLRWMVAWASKHLPAAEAEDAAQEAFIALVHKATHLRPGSSLRGFLFGLLRIAVLRAQRTLSRHRGEPPDGEEGKNDEPVDPQPDPEAIFLKRHTYTVVAEALSRVCTLREQEVVLFYMEDQKDMTTAEALGLSDNNVRVIRHRAVGKLRKALAAPAPEGADGH